MVTVYGIPHCDSVKKARSWLLAEGVDHRFHDFKRDGLPAALLDRWIAAAGLPALLNRKGLTWRRLDDAARATADDAAGARALLLRETSLVKRPVIEWPQGETSVGFDAERFAALKPRR